MIGLECVATLPRKLSLRDGEIKEERREQGGKKRKGTSWRMRQVRGCGSQTGRILSKEAVSIGTTA